MTQNVIVIRKSQRTLWENGKHTRNCVLFQGRVRVPDQQEPQTEQGDASYYGRQGQDAQTQTADAENCFHDAKCFGHEKDGLLGA